MNLILSTPDKKGHMYIGKFPFTEKYYDYVMNLELIKNPPIIVYGRKCKQNRDVKFFSDTSKGYSYSNNIALSFDLTDELKEILEYVNYNFKDEFNGILVNRYNDGRDCIGSHSDSETSLGKSGVVGIVFGATRKFRIRNKNNELVKNIEMPNGTMYHMDCNFNKYFKHEIPKQLKIKEPRVSLTFRKHLK